MVDTFHDYLRLYQTYAVNWWNHIGPKEYLTLLLLIGVFGYLSMLKGPKRIG